MSAHHTVIRTILRGTVVVTLGVLASISTADARGGALRVPCDAPFVSSLAAVNVVVLPYEFPPELSHRSKSARLLSGLIQRHLAVSTAKYGMNSVFAVQLVNTRGQVCDADTVRKQLLGQEPGAQQVVASGRGLILVWGRLFETGDELFVQTFIQFMRRGVPERVEFSISGQRLSAALSGQGFAGLERLVSKEDLKLIDDLSKGALTVYAEPSEQADQATEALRGRGFYYTVAAARVGWLRVEKALSLGDPGGAADPFQRVQVVGWVKASDSRAELLLAGLIPELLAVDGIASYLNARVKLSGAGGPASATNARVHGAAQSLVDYSETLSVAHPGNTSSATDTSGHDLAAAVSLQLAGTVEMLRDRPGNVGTRRIVKANECFRAGTFVLPADADARSLAIISGVALAARAHPAGLPPVQAEAQLLDAIALDPGNLDALRNLASLYRLQLLPPARRTEAWSEQTAAQREDTRKKLERVEEILQAAESPAGEKTSPPNADARRYRD